MIVALDLATKTGFAFAKDVGQFEKITTSGVKSFSTKNTESAGIRYLKFKKWLEENFTDATEIVYEEVRRHSATAAAHVYGGLVAVLLAFCEEHRIEYRGYPVGTIKKFATGNGNASKDMMIAAAKRWGFTPKDDNEADAIAILKLRLSEN